MVICGRATHTALAFPAIWLPLAVHLHAAGPVAVVGTGIGGDTLKMCKRRLF